MFYQINRVLYCKIMASAMIISFLIFEPALILFFPKFYLMHRDLSKVILTIASAIILYTWYCYDRELINYQRNSLGILILLIALIGVPAYLIKSRGTRRGLFYSFLAFVLLLGSVMLSAAAQWYSISGYNS